MSNYTFLPWVRKGLANYISSSTSPSAPSSVPRPVVPVKINFEAQNSNEPNPVTPKPEVTAEILGPGDVLGINASAIINTRPKAEVQNFEPYLLAAIEFYEEDFPWRYTPFNPAKNTTERLTPWLCLLVLEASEFTESLNESNARVVRVKTSALPNPNDIWAWAHVQVNKNIAGTSGTGTSNNTESFLKGELKSNGDIAFSRIFSPRKMKEYTQYHAFLVPSFEAGRYAGLKVPIPSTVDLADLAWPDPANPPSNSPTEIDFPVYYNWSFKTGKNEDFEFLARQLKPTALPPTDADITVDVSHLGYELTVESSETVIKLPTAIELPGTNYVFKNQTRLSADPLNVVLNRSFSYVLNNFINSKPIVVPPAYGRYHANLTEFPPITQSSDPKWIHQTNLDLRYRAIASVGTKIVQQRQDEYSQRAWEQLKDVLEANRNLKYMQAALQATTSLRDQHLPVYTTNGSTSGSTNLRMASSDSDRSASATSAGVETLDDYGVQLAYPVLSRIKAADGKTLFQKFREAKFPLAALSPTFRRINRPFGKFQVNQAGLPNRTSPNAPGDPNFPTPNTLLESNTGLAQRDSLLSLLNDGTLWPVPPKSSPLHVMAFNQGALQNLINDLERPERVPTPEGYPEVLAQALGEINPNIYKPVNKDDELQPVDLQDVKSLIIEATNPEPVFLARANKAIRFIPHYPEGDVPQGKLDTGPIPIKDDGGAAFRTSGGMQAKASLSRSLQRIAPVMAYPVFKDAMYKILQSYNEDLFLPGVKDLPKNIITLMQVNDRFIEAFMLGLNHEMASELLWREYPTDQRGSYFRQFWDKKDLLTPNGLTEEDLKDIKPIDKWDPTSKLGTNHKPVAGSITPPSTEPDLILLIKGDLLTKYPSIAIYAQKAKKNSTNELVPDQTGEMRFPTQRADLGDGLTMLRFSLSAAAAKSNPSTSNLGWFFLLVERPGEPAFGLDIASSLNLDKWDNLSWSHNTGPLSENYLNPNLQLINQPTPPAPPTDSVPVVENGAHLAYAVFQKPAMVAIHADQMIPH
ncbi:hypothetical protein [Adhaeribacter soli]|uniref:Uncharacterized protein n=1 Tax=Adhaeribacter soli TaxID=2607655 RepID=A0A5N1IYK1_9BACT|nr:hypothetical protein [Adhaeribacter soli]KAA9338977.1 hypothetical protein F0P94_09305 [Adhaeribacter soli]